MDELKSTNIRRTYLACMHVHRRMCDIAEILSSPFARLRCPGSDDDVESGSVYVLPGFQRVAGSEQELGDENRQRAGNFFPYYLGQPDSLSQMKMNSTAVF